MYLPMCDWINGISGPVVTYKIVASAGAGGSIAPVGTVSVTYGSNQAFTITPDTGYHVADVLVDGVSAGAVTGYTFTGVKADHTIAASFAIEPGPEPEPLPCGTGTGAGVLMLGISLGLFSLVGSKARRRKKRNRS
jgi:hypothetical protein